MSVTVEFIGDGQTTVTDVNSNVLLLRRYQTATLSDATWAGFSATQQALFQVLFSPSNLVTTKGDLLVATGPGAIARCGVGADGTVLQADSSQTPGVKWTQKSRSISDVHADILVGPSSIVETPIATHAIPSSAAGGDVFELVVIADLLNNSAGSVTYTFRFKLGSTTMITTAAASLAASVNRRQVLIQASLLVVSPSGSPDERLTAFTSITSTAASSMPIGAATSGHGNGTASEDLSAGTTNLVVTTQLGTSDANADFRAHVSFLKVFKR